MNTNYKKELPIVAIVLLPFVYLAFIWNTLPAKVPTHFNFKGEIDGWGERCNLIWMLMLTVVLTYVLMLVIPKIDPKKKLDLMGRKFYQLKFMLVGVMSLLALFILYISKNQSFLSPNIVYVLSGILFVVMGNYFKVIKQNYFLGIKTPWTLESEQVWKLTHTLAGKLWVVGGLAIIICSLIIPENINQYFFLSITAILVVVPIVYSYIYYKQLKISK